MLVTEIGVGKNIVDIVFCNWKQEVACDLILIIELCNVEADRDFKDLLVPLAQCRSPLLQKCVNRFK